MKGWKEVTYALEQKSEHIHLQDFPAMEDFLSVKKE